LAQGLVQGTDVGASKEGLVGLRHCSRPRPDFCDGLQLAVMTARPSPREKMRG
jgi:hypothetical protein